MANPAQTAISPTREQDYPEWYQQVIKAAEMAENSSVRGCMVIRPWGYGIWELLQRELDDRIKATGHENAYFPLFIPLSFLEKEAAHVDGFAKECAVVTHHRLELKDGKLIPCGELEEPLIVRPTSETIIGESFARWVQSYRDLPVLINQWANVVRWEMRTRMFLRTAEFLWQEGHTCHADQKEAMEETLRMLEVYREVAEDVLAMPVIVGEKTEGERFPGAERTFSIEAMMQDRKGLQAGTSHYLGQNFAKAADIKFLNQAGDQELAYTTSWGVSTRLIGGMIMAHGDDDGLRVPPKLAPKQVIILPVLPKEGVSEQVFNFCTNLANEIAQVRYDGKPVRVHVDKRDIRGGDKNWQWIKRGAPIRIEIGPRDIESNTVMLARRDRGVKDKEKVAVGEVAGRIAEILASIQQGMFEKAKTHTAENIVEIGTFAELEAFFTPKNAEKPEIHGGFARVKWAGSAADEEKLKDLKLTIRCIPFEQSGKSGKCIVTGQATTQEVIIAKAY